MPCRAKLSLIVQGTPCSGGRSFGALLASRRSASVASWRAVAKRSRTTALSVGFTCSMRRMCASTSSAELIALRRIIAARPLADAVSSGSSRVGGLMA